MPTPNGQPQRPARRGGVSETASRARHRTSDRTPPRGDHDLQPAAIGRRPRSRVDVRRPCPGSDHDPQPARGVAYGARRDTRPSGVGAQRDPIEGRHFGVAARVGPVPTDAHAGPAEFAAAPRRERARVRLRRQRSRSCARERPVPRPLLRRGGRSRRRARRPHARGPRRPAAGRPRRLAMYNGGGARV